MVSREDRRRIGRLGGLATSARHDSSIYAAQARQGFLRRFEDRVDPDRTLPEGERRRRADALFKAHMLALSMRSAKARAARARGDAG